MLSLHEIFLMLIIASTDTVLIMIQHKHVMDCLRILLLLSSEFKRINLYFLEGTFGDNPVVYRKSVQQNISKTKTGSHYNLGKVPLSRCKS